MRQLTLLFVLLISSTSIAQDKIFAGLYWGDKSDYRMVQLLPLDEYSHYYEQKTDLFFEVSLDVYLVLNKEGRQTLKKLLKDAPKSIRKEYMPFTRKKGDHFFYKNSLKVRSKYHIKKIAMNEEIDEYIDTNPCLKVVYF